jgi:hypothetical protein
MCLARYKHKFKRVFEGCWHQLRRQGRIAHKLYDKDRLSQLRVKLGSSGVPGEGLLTTRDQTFQASS